VKEEYVKTIGFLYKLYFSFVAEFDSFSNIGMLIFSIKWIFPLLPQCLWSRFLPCITTVVVRNYARAFHNFWILAHLQWPSQYPLHIPTVHLSLYHPQKLLQEHLFVEIIWFFQHLQGTWEWGIVFYFVSVMCSFSFPPELLDLYLCYWFSSSKDTVIVCKMVEPMLLSSSCYGEFI